MMSLVAYGSSDDDSEGEDDNNTVVMASKLKVNGSIKADEQKEAQSVGLEDDSLETEEKDTNSLIKMDTKPEEEASSYNFLNEKQDPETIATSSKDLFSKLPAPSPMTDFVARDSIISRKKSQQKGPVKILVPSLPEFTEEDEPPSKKKPQVQKSSTGTKLMSMLPAPKGSILTKETKPSLVPQSVTKKPAPPVKTKPPVRKVIPPAFLKSNRSLKSSNDSGDESDGEETSTDFFSLTADHSVPVAEVQNIVKPDVYTQQRMFQPASSSYDLEHQSTYSGYSSEYSEVAESSSTFAEPQADSDQDYIGFNSTELQLDDEAIQKLCGRKGRREENVQIIDVSGDEIMPDSREWLTKQLTQEKPSRSHRKGFGPSSQQRRKHQITYLAFQAKENELELQNQWANNRQSRRQTQSKYGF